jgi:enoyl-CoA hydratase/carnithine racemase
VTGDISVRQFGDVRVTNIADFVAEVCISRPPNNFFDTTLIRCLARAYDALERDARTRAIVLRSTGKHFCAGADLGAPDRLPREDADWTSSDIYQDAARLVAGSIPVVAAIQGGAIGGGFGLACTADFRVAARRAYFSANFARLGLHHGFGLSLTLSGIVGQQIALELLYTGRRVCAREAASIGLCDRLAKSESPMAEAVALASAIAESAPLAVRSIRATMRGDLARSFRAAATSEIKEQKRLSETQDFREAISALAERRPPRFRGA